MIVRNAPALLLVDSREKWTQGGSRDAHIREYLDRHEIPYLVKKLDVGDYTLPGSRIVVDRKQNLDEVSKNLTNPTDSARFMREVRRAREQGLQLVVLVEHGYYIKTMDDVKNWRSKYTGVSGYLLSRQMRRVSLAYGVRWEFCHKRNVTKRIIEILTERPLQFMKDKHNNDT